MLKHQFCSKFGGLSWSRLLFAKWPNWPKMSHAIPPFKLIEMGQYDDADNGGQNSDGATVGIAMVVLVIIVAQ